MSYTIENAILLFAVLLIVGVITTKFSNRLGLPALVLFIAVGMVLGRFIYFDNAAMTQFFGVFALTVILFDGGLHTKWKDIRPVLAPSLSLATVGVVLTSALTGVFAKYILGVSWLEAMLFGSIVGSTDAAAVFAVLADKDIKKKLTATLEAESGSNDPMAVFLTVSLIDIIQLPNANFMTMSIDFFLQMGLGLIFGIVLGKVGVWTINKINLDSSGLYPVLSVSLAVLIYSVTALAGGSGFLAVYVAGIVVGNADLTYRHSIFRFSEGITWMMQILMFIVLGLLVFVDQLVEVIWQGLAISVLLMLVARPVSVFLTTMMMRLTFKEKLFISWAGLRGAVPIILATFPLVAGVENGQLFFNAVFFIVLTSALIQGWTISPVANALGFAEPKRATAPHSLELVSIGKTNTEMIEIDIPEGSRTIGKRLHELDLPSSALVTAVIRGERLITPRGDTKLLMNDILYVLVSKSKREEVKEIFLSPSEEDEDEGAESEDAQGAEESKDEGSVDGRDGNSRNDEDKHGGTSSEATKGDKSRIEDDRRELVR